MRANPYGRGIPVLDHGAEFAAHVLDRLAHLRQQALELRKNAGDGHSEVILPRVNHSGYAERPGHPLSLQVQVQPQRRVEPHQMRG